LQSAGPPSGARDRPSYSTRSALTYADIPVYRLTRRTRRTRPTQEKGGFHLRCGWAWFWFFAVKVISWPTFP